MRIALRGRVVTMDDAYHVLDDGVVYVDGRSIAAVSPASAKPPAGFEAVKPIATDGTIFPGLIDLHNHLAYDALPLWHVDKKYENRDTWAGTASYRAQVTGPMKVLGSSPDVLPALIRYVECKCLLGGVTTSQGIALFSNQGIRRYYRGLVRNVEATDDADLPEALARIADVEKADAAAFAARLAKATCLLLHLSEGTNAAARAHFQALKLGSGWAIRRSLAGIHCVALEREDFDVLGAHGAAMVWSPLSNLLLYGATANVKAARAAGVPIALGADWSYSGSKSLLHELAVARAVADGAIADRELVAMATRAAAKILGWDGALGTVAAGKRADLLVVAGGGGDPYAALLEADETKIELVLIDGALRSGTAALARALGAKGEVVKVGRQHRTVALADDAADPAVAALTLAKATEILGDALHRLPALAAELEKPVHRAMGPIADGEVWYLALDELDGGKVDRAPGPPLSKIVKPIDLDPITVADDPTYRGRLAKQINLPQALKQTFR